MEDFFNAEKMKNDDFVPQSIIFSLVQSISFLRTKVCGNTLFICIEILFDFYCKFSFNLLDIAGPNAVKFSYLRYINLLTD